MQWSLFRFARMFGAFWLLLIAFMVGAMQASSRQAVAATTDKPRQQQAEADLPMPPWWDGECDTHYYRSQVGRDAFPLGGSYRGVQACGPRPDWDRVSNVLRVYNAPGQRFAALEWQCVELVMRYLFLAYGVNTYQADGKDVVWKYSGDRLEKVANGTIGRAPQPGDVMSFVGVPGNPNGHTSIVVESNIDENGNGTIRTLNQNIQPFSAEAAQGYLTIRVTNWHVGSNATGWLHDPQGDTEAPTIDLQIDPPALSSGWHTGPFTVRASAIDNVGVTMLRITVRRDGTLVHEETAAGGVLPELTFSQDGRYEITVSATDAAGNPAEASARINLDATPPTATIDIPTSDSGWYNTPPMISFSAADGLSGLAHSSYEIRRGNQVVASGEAEGAAPTALTLAEDGIYTVVLRVADIAGNLTTVRVTVRVERQAPVLAIDAADDRPALVVLANDGPQGSGVASIAYSADGGLSWSAYTGTLPALPALRIQACDVAGNCATLDGQIRQASSRLQWRNIHSTASSRYRIVEADEMSAAGVRGRGPNLPVVGGQIYRIGATVLAAEPTAQANVVVQWFDNRGRVLDRDDTKSVPGVAGAFARTLRAPAGAAFAKLDLRGVGVGEIWIDDAIMLDATGQNLLPAGDFSGGLGEHWSVIRLIDGLGEVAVAPYADGEALMVRLRPTWSSERARVTSSREEAGTVRIEQRPGAAFAVSAGSHYTLAIAAQAFDLSQAVQIKLHFYNAQGQQVGVVEADASEGDLAWQWLRLAVRAPAGATSTRAMLLLAGGGTLGLDTIILTTQ